MQKSWVVWLLLCACGVEQPTEFEHLRQSAGGAIGIPELVGDAGARLGESLGTCWELNGTYAVGAPGRDSVLYVSSQGAVVNTFAPTSNNRFGRLTACGWAGLPRQTVGVSNNAWYVQTVLNPVLVETTGATVAAMAQSDSTLNPRLLVMRDDGYLEYRNGLGAFGTGITAHQDAGAQGFALAFAPGSPDLFAVSSSLLRQVKLSTINSTTNTTGTSWYVNVNAEPGAVAVGNFHPAPGLEVAVTVAGAVWVYSTVLDAGSVPLFVHTAADPNAAGGRFGAVIKTEPGDAGGGLNALWVGSPLESVVYRWFGDAGSKLTPMSADEEFGAALAFSKPDQLIIGAPAYQSGSGATYRQNFDPGAFFTPGFIQVAQPCAVARGCKVPSMGPLCSPGTCIGGVVCEYDPQATLTACIDLGTDGGSSDAGALDAGSGDAGSTDAGTTDAGTLDAGTDAGLDAGPGDAGPEDAGVDAGATDAGAEDAGHSDAGAVDAGEKTDAGAMNPDAGLPTQFVAESCACTSGPGWPFWLALTFPLFRRRSSNLARS